MSRWGPESCEEEGVQCKLTQENNKLNNECLEVHNKYRKRHKVQELKISKEVNEITS